MGDPDFQSRQGNKYSLWCCTSSVRPSGIHTSLSTICTMLIYLLHRAATCFGHISWPLSGSYKFGRRVKYSLYGNFTRPKHVAVPYNKYKNIVKIINCQICEIFLFSKTIQTSSGARTVSHSMDIWVLSLRYGGRGMKFTIQIHLSMLRMSRAYPLLPL